MSVDLTARVAGEGPPMVILHGLFGQARNWDGIARQVGDACQVHALDLRNHGEAPWASPMDYPAMAGDVARYIEANKLGPVPVIGHSMGGKAAMWLALTQPALVSRLMVVDIAPVAYGHGFGDFVAAMQSVPLDRIARRAEVEPYLQETVPDPMVRAFLLQSLMRDGDRWRWRLNLDVLAADMDKVTGFPEVPAGTRYDGPTLFLAGARSDYIDAEHMPAIKRLFTGFTVTRMPDAGHWVHADQPKGFAAAVRDYLAEGARP